MQILHNYCIIPDFIVFMWKVLSLGYENIIKILHSLMKMNPMPRAGLWLKESSLCSLNNL
jgi:hypothetical protein